ncbi:VRR-NUC domain-containing protein [Vibrio rhizosphaerae]|uniref:VRR-NUC domain-containing protein n=1 Tax=Vibrio rhizosphaerae TaxID=398736 RepID=A0ABU4IXA8_9VIBR|nr:VRR-NUC domain-containing protein [Vibrio rhizosphaerae]MDW6094036.1 VRR-NUC domain-containing protein [Vibrio rhizosphaerae]
MDSNIYEISKAIGRTEQRSGKLKKKRREPETKECADAIRWARKTTIAGICVGDFLTHVPNEGKRGNKAQYDFYQLGGQPGYPDYIFDVARCGCHGLRIEMKAPEQYRSLISDDQRKWEYRLSEQGYLFVYCYSASEMKKTITDYLLNQIEPGDDAA